MYQHVTGLKLQPTTTTTNTTTTTITDEFIHVAYYSQHKTDLLVGVGTVTAAGR